MGYSVSYNYSGDKDKVDYISFKGELSNAEIDEIIKLGAFDRIQTTEIPTQETLVALNERYYFKFPKTGFRLYGIHAEDVDFSFLSCLSNVERLNIDIGQNAHNLSALKHLKNLKSLMLSVYLLDNFSFISDISDTLEQFSLETKKTSLDISLLNKFQNLNVLYLSGYKKNIETLANLPLLESLLLKGITLKSLAFLNEIKMLKSLRIHRGNTEDFSELYGNPTIKALQIFRITNFTDIELIAQLPNLIAVELSQLRHISHLPDLSKQTQLKHISLDEMKLLTDFTTLKNATSLESISFSCCPSEFEPDCILPVLRNPSVTQCSFYTSSEKKNMQINKYIKDFGKLNVSNFMTVRNILYSNCTEF